MRYMVPIIALAASFGAVTTASAESFTGTINTVASCMDYVVTVNHGGRTDYVYFNRLNGRGYSGEELHTRCSNTLRSGMRVTVDGERTDPTNIRRANLTYYVAPSRADLGAGQRANPKPRPRKFHP